MQVINGFPRKNPDAIHNSICMVRSVRRATVNEKKSAVFSFNVSNILLNGCDLILDRTFDRIGFNRIDDEVFRKLVKARLAYPTSKAATVEYLKNHFDEDVDLSKIYRYLDKLSDHQHEIVQDISVRHTAKLFGGNIGVLFMMSPHFTLKRIMRTTCARPAFLKRDDTVILRSYSACL